MRTLSVLLVACALVSPAVAEATRESTLTTPAKTTAVVRPHRSHHARHVSLRKRSHAKPAAKAAAPTRVSSLARDPDYPWVMPS